MTHIINLAAEWRPENMKIQHKIPLGSIVEVNVDMDGGWGPYDIIKRNNKEICIGIVGKLRMFVVEHGRDCDGTPLYSIASAPIIPPEVKPFALEMMQYHTFVRFYMHGISEDGMVKLDMDPEPVQEFADYLAEITAGI